MKIVRRSDLGWGSIGGFARVRQGVCLHYNGGPTGISENASHQKCINYWRSTRNYHRNGNGWRDIGYAWGACPHGYLFEGRGFDRTQAAQPGGNSSHQSITLMIGGSETPSPKHIRTVQEAIAYLRGRGVGHQIKGHRDFYSTSCPGNAIYQMLRSGIFEPGFDLNVDEPEEDELDMARMRWLSSGMTQRLVPGERNCLMFNNGTDDRITKENRYATFAFPDVQFWGVMDGRVVAFDDDGEWVRPAYRIEMGKLHGHGNADKAPAVVIHQGVFETSEFIFPVNHRTYEDQYARLYITPLNDHGTYEFRGGFYSGLEIDK